MAHSIITIDSPEDSLFNALAGTAAMASIVSNNRSCFNGVTSGPRPGGSSYNTRHRLHHDVNMLP